jgi:hypothetical protein
MQVDMRAPGRGHKNITIGTPDGGQGLVYHVSDTGIASVHSSHVAAVKALGFTLCADENPEAPPIASLSEEDWAAVREFKKLQAKAAIEAKAKEEAEALQAAKAEAASKAAQAAIAKK